MKLKPGMRVRVLWGLDTVEGTILEVWSDPPRHVRIALELGGPEKPEDVVTLLLSPSVIEEALSA
jgi:hypothetical protein